MVVEGIGGIETRGASIGVKVVIEQINRFVDVRLEKGDNVGEVRPEVGVGVPRRRQQLNNVARELRALLTVPRQRRPTPLVSHFGGGGRRLEMGEWQLRRVHFPNAQREAEHVRLPIVSSALRENLRRHPTEILNEYLEFLIEIRIKFRSKMANNDLTALHRQKDIAHRLRPMMSLFITSTIFVYVNRFSLPRSKQRYESY